MPTVTIQRMREIEADVLARGCICEAELLQSAGTALGHAVARHFNGPGLAVGFIGKGHNAGDALVALGVLRQQYGWNVALRPAFAPDACAPLTHTLWLESSIPSLSAAEVVRAANQTGGPLLLLDGLVGTGARGDLLRGALADLAAEMQFLRDCCGARVAAVDVPSGVDADSGCLASNAVCADVTFMMANPKRGLLLGAAAANVGALALVPIPVLRETASSDEIALMCPQEMDVAKSHRPYVSHKGHYGRVWLWVGSQAYAGAAALAALGALTGGAGLVTVFTPADATTSVRSLCPPEVMLRTLDWERLPDPAECDALVIGCGLGPLSSAATSAWLDWLESFHGPAVIDADALNALARHGGLLRLKPNHVMTPHPGEFARLFPDCADLPREMAARHCCDRSAPVLLLKGARTIITQKHQPLWCNGTGGPAMACGGQGDLLAGVIGALLGRGLSPQHAAALAAWTCGRAAERALQSGGHSEESLTPSATASHLGEAFNDWRRALR